MVDDEGLRQTLDLVLVTGNDVPVTKDENEIENQDARDDLRGETLASAGQAMSRESCELLHLVEEK